MSSTATESTQAGVYGLGVMALGQHIHSHRLPVPFTITFPMVFDPVGPFTVSVADEDHHQWLTSVAIDSSVEEPIGRDRVRTTWQVRLDDGTRIQLVALRKVPFAVLTGGAA